MSSEEGETERGSGDQQWPSKTRHETDSRRREPPYTTFSLRYRWYMTMLLGYLCLASTITANIYFPLINVLAAQYHTSIYAINLTITAYVIVQGIAPSIFSPLSDTLGRRPVYLLSFALYTAASVGLAYSESSYAGLLSLRAVQSLGGSATQALAYAVVADFAVNSERGRFLGPMMVATNLGTCVGPPIGGGVILATRDARWAFWTLVIYGGLALVLIAVSLRETNRDVVGNGSVRARGVWRAGMDTVSPSSEAGEVRKGDGFTEVPSGKGKFSIPNPLSSLRILTYRDALVVLYLVASPYASWYTVTASIPLIYGVDYGFSDLVVGLCYLAGGAGILAGGFLTGRLMDHNYKWVALASGLPVDSRVGDDIRTFPIERARSRGSYIIIGLSAVGFVAYGWIVQYGVHYAATLILQFFTAAATTSLVQVYSALMVDMFPDMPGTAGAANNTCRCALSAAAVAALQPLVDGMGRAWFFTLVGLWQGIGSCAAVLVLRRWGPGWREERLARADGMS